MTDAPNVLLIDHYDSFVHILADLFARRGCRVQIRRSSWPAAEATAAIAAQPPDMLVLSPGPGRPEDHPTSLQLLRTIPGDLPVFGVCLGLQCIVTVLGGTVDRSGRGEYGRTELSAVAAGSSIVPAEVGAGESVWMSHFDAITEAPPGFTVHGSTADAPAAIIENDDRDRTVQQVIRYIVSRLAEGFDKTPDEVFA